MSAEFLREAAAAIRERADLPYVKGNWEADGIYVRNASNTPRIGYPAHAMSYLSLHDEADALVTNEAIAAYIASWHPAVALAVARWLEAESHEAETEVGDGITIGGPSLEALNVARAYLGRQP